MPRVSAAGRCRALSDYRLTETGSSLTYLVKSLADWSLEHRVEIARARETYDSEHPDNEIR
ncbi:hypothetical protein ACF1AO_20175 [Streptomyces longwoodensis]|uniref:hypothetical protein n=1 Tax=Streptomyces longwoodensis TaxID=68231 RepID=UPI0036FC2E5A